MRAVAAYLVLVHLIQATIASGFFEVQILSLTNNQGTLVDGRCCGGGKAGREEYPPCTKPCSTFFWLCLKEYQSNVTAKGPCSFGNVSSHALGLNTFTLSEPVTLQLHFTFRWTRQFTLILQAKDEPTDEPIEETSYSGIVLPGAKWHTLKHPGRNAHLVYRVRVQCDENYYNATCTKFCRPRDDIFGHYICDENGDKACIQGWKGVDCETAVCKEGCHPVHGHCNVSGECQCRHGWQGELCDQCMVYPGCKHGYCNGSSWQCICDTNWGGILCDQDLNVCGTREPCQNGGTCENTKPDQYRCTCPDGFSGTDCENVDNPCASNPCVNGATCRELGEIAQCECAPGFTGPYCATDIDECVSQPCQNGGTCVDGKNSFTCNCPPAWQGVLCQFDVDECTLKEPPCKNFITCVNLAGDYRCRCRSGFTGKNCTKNIDDCVGQCQHGALCIDLVDDYHCSCSPGYSGKDCDIDIDECASKPCQNGGECRDLVNKYECVCPVGFTGYQCEIDRDHCSPNPCRNSAPCFNTQTDYYCHCPVQWKGKNCSEPVPHNPQFGVTEQLGCGSEGAPCGGRGRCSGGRCICNPGYTGTHCHENINDCRGNPCLNGGTCVDLVNSFQCVCREGWNGDLCDQNLDECATQPCRNNGTCVDGVADFTCICRGGWKGKTCALRGSHCEPGTCRNGGTCQDHGDSFACHCPLGWGGAACHIASPSACARNPCENSATCVNTADGSYRCVCREGFEGPNCRRNIDDCQLLPCLNGGKCVDGVNWFRCECAPGFTGPDCRINVNDCASNPCTSGATCIDGIASYTCICPPGRTGPQCEIRTAGGPGCTAATWNDDCNVCECRNGKNQCSNVWCGPANCLNGSSCFTHEVCVPSPGESCLTPPCLPWGECRPVETGRRVGPPALPAPPSCWPGQSIPGPTCSRLAILLRKETLTPGTSVELLCRHLRKLLADPRRPQSVVLLCDLKPGDNDTVEVTIFSEAAAEVARDLGEMLSRSLARPLAFASVLEVKVETALLSEPSLAGASNTGGYIAVLGSALAIVLVLALFGGLWYLKTVRHRSNLTPTTSSETSLHRHRSDLDEKSNNLQNEENLRRYANPLKDSDPEPRVSVVRPLSGTSLGTLSGTEESLEMVSEEGRHCLPPLYKPPSAEARNNTASFSYEEGPHKPYSKPRLQEPPYPHQQPGTSQTSGPHQMLTTLEDDAEDEALEYENTDMWTEDDEDETVEAKEEKSLEAESVEEMIDLSDILVDYMKRFKARRTKELSAEAEEEKKQLRYLIGIEEKRERDASVETIITPEDELTVSDRVSTESLVHPCLREIDISESQLKILNPYTVYQVPDDPGLLPAFWLLRERPPIYSTDGVQKFYDMVKRAGIRSIASLKDLLVTDQINLRYYGLESQVMRAICEALMDNTYIRKVDLKDNKLSAEACKHLNNLLLRNSTIIDLSLSGCQIGANGAEKLYHALSTNTTLKTLDLSNCNIENEGFEHIASALSNNQSLESINLSNNNLDESCAENLRNLLSYNDTLTHLNLFWNSLYTANTWKTLIKGFEKNETLRSLNLSWNGLGIECLPYLSQLLSRSRSIEKMDLSCNRFTENDAIRIAKALSANNTLQELYLGSNPLKAEGALTLVRAITPQISPDNVLHLLDLENVWANKDILQELETIKKLKPEVKVKLRGVLSNYQLVGPNVRKILLKRANYEAMAPKRKSKQRNFGHFVMSLDDKMISREKFKTSIKKFKLKLSKSLIDEIMHAFEGPRRTVDQEQLKLFYLKEFLETIVN